MPGKEARQRLIAEIVGQEFVSTQSELVKRLRQEGFKVTQATVSRDINELRLVRLPVGNGRHKYAVAPIAVEENVIDELRHLFREFVRDLDRGENLIAIRTEEGHATGVAFMLDKLQRHEIIGTLAGQDTIMLVARNAKAADALLKEMHGWLE